MQFSIRPATTDDIDWLLVQTRAFAAFTGLKNVHPTEDYARFGLTQLLTDHVLLICEHESAGNVGFVAGYRTPHPFNPALTMLSETFWWVAEEHRGSRAGLMLLDAFIDIGRRTADIVTCALESNSPVNERVLTDRGFKLHERSFLLETK